VARPQPHSILARWGSVDREVVSVGGAAAPDYGAILSPDRMFMRRERGSERTDLRLARLYASRYRKPACLIQQRRAVPIWILISGDRPQHGLVPDTDWMADAGVPVHVLRKIAGHGSLTTTQRYVHPDQDPIISAGEALSAHLFSN
jgi:hypothetical protein